MSQIEAKLPKGITVMLVDAGYLSGAPKIEGGLPEPVDDDNLFAFHRNFPPYGSYDAYLANLIELYDALKEAGVHTAFVMTDELEEEYEPHHMHFMPFEEGLVLNIIPEERRCLGVVPAEFYELDVDEDGLIKSKKPTNPLEITGKLGDLLLVAGELATYKPGFEGCVGGIVSKFEPYIPILGIKGAIFPLNEYLEDFVAQGVMSVPFEKWIRGVHERIYHQAVSLNQILNRRPDDATS